jgi:hypothetical protein
LIGQQLPPPQQSAEREVALAVPTSARAATIANKYFIGILQLSFLSTLVRQLPERADAIESNQARGGGTGGRCERLCSEEM